MNGEISKATTQPTPLPSQATPRSARKPRAPRVLCKAVQPAPTSAGVPPIVYPDLVMPQPPVYAGSPSPDTVRPDAEGRFDEFLSPSTSPVTPPTAGRDRILIAVPLLRVSYEFFESFLKFWTGLITRDNPRYEICYHFAYRRPVHMAEEYLVQAALYNKCTHILFMDDDIFDVTPDDLDKLYNADKDVIAGIMHASKFPHAMCAFRRYDTKRKVIDMPVETNIFRLYEIPCLCPACGTAQTHWDTKFCICCGGKLDNLVQCVDLIPFCFTLIKMSVFSKIKQPWFHCTNKFPTDSWFADRILEAGLREHAHMGVRLNHGGVTDASRPHYIAMGMEKARETSGIVELSPAQMEIHSKALSQKMIEVEAKLKDKPEIVFSGHVVANKAKHKGRTLVTGGL